jgi:hypothetical protein
MTLTPIQQQALTRWHDLGDMTPTHPVLQSAYELYIAPMGISCDAISYDALAAVADPSILFRLRAPNFDPKKVDREWEFFPAMEPLIKVSDLIAPNFNPDGSIAEFIYKKEIVPDNTAYSTVTDSQHADSQRLREFKEQYAESIFALSDQVISTTRAYIDTCLSCMTQPEEVSSEYARIFVENPKIYTIVMYKAIIKRSLE